MKQLTFPFCVYLVHDVPATIEDMISNRDGWSCVTIDVSEYEYDMLASICRENKNEDLPVDYLQKDIDTLGVHLRLSSKIDKFVCSPMGALISLGEEEMETIKRGYLGLDDYDELPELSQDDMRYIIINITRKMIGAPLEFDKDGEAKKAKMMRIK